MGKMKDAQQPVAVFTASNNVGKTKECTDKLTVLMTRDKLMFSYSTEQPGKTEDRTQSG